MLISQPAHGSSEQLLRRYIELHNDAVDAGDFTGLTRLFAADATLSFHGLPRPFGPFHGRAAIAEAFAAHPPDDELLLGKVEAQENAVEARYRWSNPQTRGGRLHLRATQGRITQLTIYIDPDPPEG